MQKKLCQMHSIADQDYSLNAGRYVGVVIEDDGMTEEEFKQKMISLNDEFNELSKEANKLEKSINANIKELFAIQKKQPPFAMVVAILLVILA